ncbi:hypothetical protein [Halogeometricum luteum]|uniref:Uncharacterized protein n=1 Tax=Halogeometricum luteum TaxID=2950537 RepID=A0ABU2G8J4_9EURY|nr:hypothetical protein [Halogeometricum sp. S3BR5-2]MDS0297104.1 hypothetical protein [Halogeometricum sp. S3BR5-2]
MSEKEMKRRSRLAENVTSGLSRNERETSIHFFGDSDTFEITTYSTAIVRQILKHSLAEIEWVYLVDRDGSGKGRASVGQADDSRGTGVEGVCASLPLGALSVKGTRRASDRPSGVVCTPEESEAARRRFGGSESSPEGGEADV